MKSFDEQVRELREWGIANKIDPKLLGEKIEELERREREKPRKVFGRAVEHKSFWLICRKAGAIWGPFLTRLGEDVVAAQVLIEACRDAQVKLDVIHKLPKPGRYELLSHESIEITLAWLLEH